MKKNLTLTLAVLAAFTFGFQITAAAQFPIKIPKIGKPKTEQPKTEQPGAAENQPAPTETKTGENRQAAQTSGKGERLMQPEKPAAPQFLIETLEIKAHNENKFWKAPNQNDYSCWYPLVSFDVLYAEGAPKLRFRADWYNADGSLWFSEPLEFDTGNEFPHLRSQYEGKELDPRAVTATGSYGLKITDTKTNQTVFQGKFKVGKLPLDPKLKTKNLFYVDNDWNLPVGYVGFKRTYTDYDVHTRPMAFFWFKGIPDERQFEAELYFNNQRVATTAKGGNVNKYAERGEECYLARDVCAHSLWGFEWENFVVDNSPSARPGNPNGFFTNDHPGEYTTKIFYKGDQVREAKFTVDQKGWIARNAVSNQIYLDDYRIAVPVKVMGTMEKWNPATWKTDVFYGNPLNGF